MFYTQSEQNITLHKGEEGRPKDYPTLDDYGELLFYIQRNQNINTVVYEVNLLPGGILNLNDPISIYWVYYNEKEEKTIQPLNYIQKKLAYGYHHSVISSELVEFRFVSYDQMIFYLGKDKQGRFKVFTRFEDTNVEISMMYIFAEDLGVFPQVKFVEFFGKESTSSDIFYQKLLIP